MFGKRRLEHRDLSWYRFGSEAGSGLDFLRGERCRMWNALELRHVFPDGGKAALLAIANQAAMNRADISLEIAVFESEKCFADGTFQNEFLVRFGVADRRRKFHVPEIQRGLDESYAIRVQSILEADRAYNADLHFAVGFERTKRQLLLGDQRFGGDESGAVKAEHDGMGALGKEAPLGVAAHEENGNLFGNASAAAETLLVHPGNLGKGPRFLQPPAYPESTVCE